MRTAYGHGLFARFYPDARTGCSYYFAEAALLDKEKASRRRVARVAKLSVAWISHRDHRTWRPDRPPQVCRAV